MKKLFIICCIFFIALNSCKKDEEIINNPPVAAIPVANTIDEFTMFHAGNYWIYQTYKIDSNGVETLLPGTDSCYIAGDTIIGSYAYQIVHKYWLIFGDKFLRDSSGFLIDQLSFRYLSTAISNDTFYVYDGNSPGHIFTTYCIVKSLIASVTVPAGTFNNILDVGCYEYHHPPLDTTHNPLTTHTYFVKNVGKISEQYYFSAEWLFFNTVRERRLIRYHVN